MTDDREREITSAEYIIKPNGFSIPADVTRVHGITTEIALQTGRDLQIVLDEIVRDIAKASVLIAHNVQFDEKILGLELLRSGYPNHVEMKDRKCTMKSSTNFCRLPGNYGYKWPSLEELHLKLFGERHDGAHCALADARACARCYFELRRLGVMT